MILKTELVVVDRFPYTGSIHSAYPRIANLSAVTRIPQGLCHTHPRQPGQQSHPLAHIERR